ncbi:hypothetical protein cyc_04778 [Cyclospora cayetanensis]|uniref:Transmembrane protein n=1 Tax=Cyclospora cayetanensis TaxID=88456 RepID=A0A1D3CVX4_9EIME|nr:hypothetical protein cyc_04778 [Cyclospora cayetanensis]
MYLALLHSLQTGAKSSPTPATAAALLPLGDPEVQLDGFLARLPRTAEKIGNGLASAAYLTRSIPRSSLIQARGVARSNISTKAGSSGTPSKKTLGSGLLWSRLFGGNKPVEIPLHVRGDKRDMAAKACPSGAAAGDASGSGVILSPRAPLLLLLLLGALLCYITFGGLLFTFTGGLLGGPPLSAQQQRDTAAGATAEAPADTPTLQALGQALVQLREQLSTVEGVLREHDALLGALAPLPPLSVSSAAAGASRFQRAKGGALGDSVASHGVAVDPAGAALEAGAARAQPLLQLLERAREAAATQGASTQAEAPPSVSPSLMQRSFAADVASEGRHSLPAVSQPAIAQDSATTHGTDGFETLESASQKEEPHAAEKAQQEITEAQETFEPSFGAGESVEVNKEDSPVLSGATDGGMAKACSERLVHALVAAVVQQ